MKHFGKFWVAVLGIAILLGMTGCPGTIDGGGAGESSYRAVEDVKAVLTSERAVLSWSKPTEDWFGVRIEISPKVEGWNSAKVYKDETSVLVQGLKAETEYKFTLTTVDEEGKDTEKTARLEFTTPKAPAPVIQEVEKPADTTPAGKVTELVATAGDAMAALSWKNPTDADLYGVEITVGATGAEPKSVVLKKPAEAYAVYDLKNGTEYTFSVRTIDNTQNYSDAETKKATPADSSDKTAPADVTNLAATSDDTTVTLTWMDATDADIFGYEITCEDVTVASAASRAIVAMDEGSVFVAKGTQRYTFLGLEAGKTYKFTVKTMDTSGNKSNGLSKDVHIHSYNTEWEKDKTHHWLVATCGHEVESGKSEHTFNIIEEKGKVTKTCITCKATFSGPILKSGAEHDPTSLDQSSSNNQFTNALYATGANAYSVNKIVFGLLSDSNVKEAVENKTVKATQQNIGIADGECYAYFDAENGIVYIVPSSEDADFFILDESCNYLFYGYEKCTEIAGLELCDTSRVISMYYMFWNCSELESVDVSGFDTSNVTNMAGMFRNCSKLTNIDVSGFDTSNVIYMPSMFESCKALKSVAVSHFNTSNVENMACMFESCKALKSVDVSGFDTSNATTINGIFYGCESLESVDVSHFNTSKVENFGFVFYGCSGLKNIYVSNFNTSSATDMAAMFYGCSSLESLDVSNFNTSKVISMTRDKGIYPGMFQNCSSLTELDLSSFDTTNVTTMQNMFAGCTNLEKIYVKDPATFVPATITDESKKADMFKDCLAQEFTNIANKQ